MSAERAAIVGVFCFAAAGTAADIPPAKRITASVVRIISAPAEQPLTMPTDVAVDRLGLVYVADGVNDRVARFRPDGSLDRSIAALESGSLQRPVGIFVDAQDRLWIADTGNRRVVVLSPDGVVIEEILTLALDAARPADPTDVALSADGSRLFLVDNDNHRILVREGTESWRALGKYGRSLGQLEWPFMLAVNADGDVFVTEAVGGRVQRLNARFEWSGQLGRWGVEPGQLYRPKGLAIEPAGRIFVGDSTLGVVQVFERRGGFEGVLTDPRGAPLQFQHPMGMCFDTSGRLYVVEMRAHRVAVVALRRETGGP